MSYAKCGAGGDGRKPRPNRIKKMEKKKYDHWIIVGDPKVINDKTYVYCRCVCGVEKFVSVSNLRKRQTKSCGCAGKPLRRQFRREFRAWSLMKYRCCTITSSDWNYYGGRGITVCPQWLIKKDGFERFLKEIGPMPNTQKWTVDRLDVNQGYRPGNIRWATMAEQAQNKRNTHWVVYRGKLTYLSEAARQCGLSFQTIKARLKRGWSIERALTEQIK